VQRDGVQAELGKRDREHVTVTYHDHVPPVAVVSDLLDDGAGSRPDRLEVLAAQEVAVRLSAEAYAAREASVGWDRTRLPTSIPRSRWSTITGRLEAAPMRRAVSRADAAGEERISSTGMCAKYRAVRMA
jgi:hypothetical protein